MKPTATKPAVAQEEIFGPVATVIKFKTEEEVIKMANDSEYGLGGAQCGVPTSTGCLRVSNALETGRVWVNWLYNRLLLPARRLAATNLRGIGRENPQK